MTMSWSLTMQRRMSSRLAMHSLPNVCLKILCSHGESQYRSRTSTALLLTILMASCRWWKFPWNLDACQMESHSCSIFLMAMRRLAGLKGWHRFFMSKDSRPNRSCMPSVMDSVVRPVKPIVAVADCSTTNLISCKSNLSLRQPAMQRVSRCCFCQNSIASWISLSKPGVMQNACIVNFPCHRRSLILRRMSLKLLIQCYSSQCAGKLTHMHLCHQSGQWHTIAGMQYGLNDSWMHTEGISVANKQLGQPKSTMATTCFQKQFFPSSNISFLLHITLNCKCMHLYLLYHNLILTWLLICMTPVCTNKVQPTCGHWNKSAMGRSMGCNTVSHSCDVGWNLVSPTLPLVPCPGSGKHSIVSNIILEMKTVQVQSCKLCVHSRLRTSSAPSTLPSTLRCPRLSSIPPSPCTCTRLGRACHALHSLFLHYALLDTPQWLPQYWGGPATRSILHCPH